MLFLSSICVGQDNLLKLIDTCDFVKFKQAYEESGLFEAQKAELLKKVDVVIAQERNKLKSFYADISPSTKDGKLFKRRMPLFMYSIAGLFGCSSLFFAYMVKYFLDENKQAKIQFGRTAAFFNEQQWGGILGASEKVKLIAKFGISIAALGFGFSVLGTIKSVLIGRSCKPTLVIYKRWKNAQKIKELMQQNFELVDVTELKK